MNNEARQIGEVIGSVLPLSVTPTSSEPTPQDVKPETLSTPESGETKPSERQSPLRTAWQRKWLDLEVTHPDVQALADHAGRFCDRWFKDDRGRRLLVLAGPTGCGKTHVARWVWRWASALAFTRWQHHKCPSEALPTTSMAEWCNFASPEFTEDRQFGEWLEGVDSDSMFVLDDIGVETDRFKTGIPAARLCQFLNRRVNKFTLITTNEPATRWKERWDARVEDRLLRDSVVFEMAAPSYTIAQP